MKMSCDYKLRIWRLVVRATGSRNEKNSIDHSFLCNKIRDAKCTGVRAHVAGYNLKSMYYLSYVIIPAS